MSLASKKSPDREGGGRVEYAVTRIKTAEGVNLFLAKKYQRERIIQKVEMGIKHN
jgi:hypothetical protein